MSTETVKQALANLELPEYAGIRTLFRVVLTKRSRSLEPRCTLFNWLAVKAYPLMQLDNDCDVFAKELGVAEAQRKCHADVLGNIDRPFLEFNGSCADFWSEMAAIRVLKENGYTNFKAIHKKRLDGTTSDYEAARGQDLAYIEVKNIRPTRTILDVFQRELRSLYEKDPQNYSYSLGFEYPYDNPPTAEQERRIKRFLADSAGRPLPFSATVDLGDVTTVVHVEEGFGNTFQTRSISFDSPEPVDKQKFLMKIRQKAEEAYVQMKEEKRLKALVINYDAPSGSVSSDFLSDARAVVKQVFNNAVDVYVLFYRHLPEL
jgi:hypothetical protein